MPEPADTLARLQAASQRVRDAESQLADARAELRATMHDARQAGASLSAIGRVLGVSRQRVQRVLEEGR